MTVSLFIMNIYLDLVMYGKSWKCKEEKEARIRCWNLQGGIDTEFCFQEELNEKRCLSFLSCPAEAKLFYGTPGKDDEVNKGRCSLWAEAFAFEDEKHLSTRAEVNTFPKAQRECRKIAMDLVKCMSKLSHDR